MANRIQGLNYTTEEPPPPSFPFSPHSLCFVILHSPSCTCPFYVPTYSLLLLLVFAFWPVTKPCIVPLSFHTFALCLDHCVLLASFLVPNTPLRHSSQKSCIFCYHHLLPLKAVVFTLTKSVTIVNLNCDLILCLFDKLLSYCVAAVLSAVSEYMKKKINISMLTVS